MLQSPHAAPRVPQPCSGTACPLLGREKPQPLLRGWSHPLPLAPGDAWVRAPASPPAPQEGGRWEGNLLCGSVSSREAAELPWDFAWRMPEGVFKGLRCFCSRLGVVIFCLVFVSFLRLSLSGTGSALGSPWPWLVQLHRHKPPVPVSLPLVPAAPQRCQWPRLLWVHHAQVQAVPHGAWHPKPRVSRGGDSSLCPDRAPGLNDLPRVTRRIRAG